MQPEFEKNFLFTLYKQMRTKKRNSFFKKFQCESLLTYIIPKGGKI